MIKSTAQKKKPLNYSGFFVVCSTLLATLFIPNSVARTLPNNAEVLTTETEKSWYDSLLGRTARESLDWLLNKHQDVELTPAEARALPYAAQYMRMGEGARNLVVLGEVDNVAGEPRLQWYSATDEVVDTYQGRIVSIANLKHAQVKAVWLAAVSADQLVFDKRVTSPYHTEHVPHLMTTRESYRVQRHQESSSLTMPNGDQVTTRVVLESLYPATEPTDTAVKTPIAVNEFHYDVVSGRAVKTKQWLGTELGYLESLEVQPYLASAPNNHSVAWGFEPAAGVVDLKRQDGGNPTDYLQIHVLCGVCSDEVNDPTQHHFSGLFYSHKMRLNTVVTEFHQQGFAQLPYEPLTRLHSPKLDQWFAGRKSGMLMRLRMLEQTYRSDGEEQLAAQAAELAEAFLTWPLRATYLHGWSLGTARLYQSDNPMLSVADAVADVRTTAVIPRYEVSFQPAPPTAIHVGLATPLAAHELVYVTDATGKITRVPVQGYNSTPALRTMTEQPGAIVLHSIADKDLPKGFRDLNEQLALFLQHWDWSVRPE